MKKTLILLILILILVAITYGIILLTSTNEMINIDGPFLFPGETI